MKFEQDFIEKVRDANNIADIISQYTELKGAGERMTGLCPFPDHNEKTPSFSVSTDKQLYYCFGCRKSGNVYNIVQALMGLSFPEAVEYLAQRAHIPVPKDFKNSSDSAHYEKRKLMWKINRYAKNFYVQKLNALSENHPVKAYCRDRGLSAELLEQFEIGYAPESWDALAGAMKRNNAPLDVARQLGLVRPRKEGNGDYDIFRHRLIFPIQSRTGQDVGFGGRVFSDEQQPKYLNSSESEIFSKGKIFYGLNHTAKFIRSADVAVVVEGYMDFLALYKAGVTNVVATLGTALTVEHAKLLKRYTPNVVVLFDGDDAGQSAAERSLPVLLKEELRPRALFLPDKLDPDDYIKKFGVKALVKLLHESPELFTIILNKYLKGFRGRADEKLRLLDKLGPYLEATVDSRLKDLYVQELADRLGQNETWVNRQLSKKTPNLAPQGPKAPTITKKDSRVVISQEGRISLHGVPTPELELVNVALMDQRHLRAILDSEVMDHLSHDGVREIFHVAAQWDRQMPNEFDKLTASLMSRAEPNSALTRHLGEGFKDLDMVAQKRMLQDCAQHIKKAYSSRKIRAGISELRGIDPKAGEKKLEQIMKEIKSKHLQKRHPES